MEKREEIKEYCIDKAISIILCKALKKDELRPSATVEEVIEVAKQLEEYIKKLN